MNRDKDGAIINSLALKPMATKKQIEEAERLIKKYLSNGGKIKKYGTSITKYTLKGK